MSRKVNEDGRMRKLTQKQLEEQAIKIEICLNCKQATCKGICEVYKRSGAFRS